MDGLIARSVNNPWPDNDAGDSELLTKMRDYFLLFDFRETISFPSKLGSCLDRAGSSNILPCGLSVLVYTVNELTLTNRLKDLFCILLPINSAS